MSDANLLMLSLGPIAIHVRVDRESKGISEAQLGRKWATTRNQASAMSSGRRSHVRVALECLPTVRVECE